MSDFTKLSQQELEVIISKTINEKVPENARGMLKNNIEGMANGQATVLHSLITESVKTNPTLTNEQRIAEVTTKLPKALEANEKFMENFNSLNNMAKISGKDTITTAQVAKETEQELIKLSSPAQAQDKKTAPATPPAKPLHEAYSTKDAASVASAVASTAGLPQYNSAELDKILTTTMVNKQRFLPDAIKGRKPDDPLMQLWETLGLDETFKALQMFLMKMFMGKDGDVYAAARDSGQAMFDAANAIKMTGPGEGIFENYQSSQSFKGGDGVQRTIGVQDLQHIAIFNTKIREAGGKDTDAGKKLAEEREQFAQKQFGMSSDAVWGVFQQDKQNLTIAVLDKMGAEARANGLIDTPNGVALYQGFLGAVDGKRGNAAVKELLQLNRNNIDFLKDKDGNILLDEKGEPTIVTKTGVQEQSKIKAAEEKEALQNNTNEIKISTSTTTQPTPTTVAALNGAGDISISATSSESLKGTTPANPTNNPIALALLKNSGTLNLGFTNIDPNNTGVTTSCVPKVQTSAPAISKCF